MMMLNNTPYGCHALEDNTTGARNTAIGFYALGDNAMGNGNTATGFWALRDNVMGNDNTAIGFSALYTSTGSDNIALGYRAAVYHITGDHNIHIGNPGMVSEAGQIRIGTPGLQTGTYIAGINNAAVTGSPVVVGFGGRFGGRLGVTTSSARFKEAIKPMDEASEAILALKPVSFHYKKEVDPDGIPQFGLVAEEVEKVKPDLVVRDKEGKPYTVRYDAVNAMLLNEFLKEHRRVEELKAGFVRQQKDFQAIVGRQQKQIEALTAGLQKVSAQLELRKSAPQTVLNSQ
jgi:hypothetical protein